MTMQDFQARLETAGDDLFRALAELRRSGGKDLAGMVAKWLPWQEASGLTQ